MSLAMFAGRWMKRSTYNANVLGIRLIKTVSDKASASTLILQQCKATNDVLMEIRKLVQLIRTACSGRGRISINIALNQ